MIGYGELVERSLVLVIPKVDCAAVDRTIVFSYVFIWAHDSPGQQPYQHHGRSAIALRYTSLLEQDYAVVVGPQPSQFFPPNRNTFHHTGQRAVAHRIVYEDLNIIPLVERPEVKCFEITTIACVQEPHPSSLIISAMPTISVALANQNFRPIPKCR